MTLDQKEEMSRSIAKKITTKVTAIPWLGSYQSSKEPASWEATSEYAVRLLAQVWSKETGRDYNIVLDAVTVDEGRANITPLLPVMPTSVSARPSDEDLPPKPQVQRWINTFLNGPNKLFRICDPEETQMLLNAVYGSETELDRFSTCLIHFQIAAGCKLTEDTSEQQWTALFEKARKHMEACVEEDGQYLLWIVPVLLLTVLMSMMERPKTCWLTLGRCYFACSCQ